MYSCEFSGCFVCVSRSHGLKQPHIFGIWPLDIFKYLVPKLSTWKRRIEYNLTAQFWVTTDSFLFSHKWHCGFTQEIDRLLEQTIILFLIQTESIWWNLPLCMNCLWVEWCLCVLGQDQGNNCIWTLASHESYKAWSLLTHFGCWLESQGP